MYTYRFTHISLAYYKEVSELNSKFKPPPGNLLNNYFFKRIYTESDNRLGYRDMYTYSMIQNRRVTIVVFNEWTNRREFYKSVITKIVPSLIELQRDYLKVNSSFSKYGWLQSSFYYTGKSVQEDPNPPKENLRPYGVFSCVPEFMTPVMS